MYPLKQQVLTLHLILHNNSQAQIETLTQKLSEFTLTVTKSDKVAAYSEPQVGCPSKVEELTELLKHMGNQGGEKYCNFGNF